MKIIYLALLFLTPVLNIYAYQNILITSVPKTGTHLLSKCVSIILNTKHIPNNPNFIDVLNKVQNKSQKILCTHMPHDKNRSKTLLKNKYKGLFIYRDPRDTVVSLGYWWAKPTYSEYSDQFLSDLILTTKITPVAMKANGIIPNGVNEYFRIFMDWQNDPNFFTVKFEDLVGTKGGGSRIKQKNAISKIANHIGIDLSDKEVQDIQNKLFGRITFRKGQIGSWKKRFTAHHKKIFKKVAGQLLIDLGYEKDLNW